MENVVVWVYVAIRYLLLRLFFLTARVWHAPIDDDDEFIVCGDEGEGLLVILHGIGASRSHFLRQVHHNKQQLLARGMRYRRIYAPRVVYDRNRSIFAANQHVISNIRQLHEQHDDEPIHIIGMSAGGRLAVCAQYGLRNITVPMKIVTVGSPLNGTSLVSCVPKRLARWIVGPTLLRDFDPDCGAEQLNLAEYIQYSAPNRHFYHCYSTTDWMVFPPHRCATAIGKPRAYAVPIRAVAHGELLTQPQVLDCL